MSDIVLYDILNNIWTPLAQAGFIPSNEEGQFGRYNFGMGYDRMSSQVVIFGGQSGKGTFCKPNVHLF
jgi:hypothetical protein